MPAADRPIPECRIFIDEFGNHDLKSAISPEQQYLGLLGVIMFLEYADGKFAAALDALKQEVFGTTDIVLHRKEIVRRKPPFEGLEDPALRQKFDDLLWKFITGMGYRVVTAIIDKIEHKRRYTVWRFHPYHYCLTVLLERYVQWLERCGYCGDVMVESRGEKENRQLEASYKYLYRNGSDHVPAKTFQARLTSGEIKIRTKTSNIPGLQLADLIVNPACRALICEKTGVQMAAPFGKQIAEHLVKNKYLRNPYDGGTVTGWGTKWLP